MKSSKNKDIVPLNKISDNNLEVKDEITPRDMVQLEFMNFVETFIHMILYIRDVYPKEAFVIHHSYGPRFDFLRCIIEKNVCAYIKSFLDAISPLLANDLIKKIYIMIINDKYRTVYETFIIECTLGEYYEVSSPDEIIKIFGSVLYDVYYKFVNQETGYEDNKEDDLYRSFELCIETKEKIIAKKLYDKCTGKINNRFFHDLLVNNRVDNLTDSDIAVEFLDEGSVNLKVGYLKGNKKV